MAKNKKTTTTTTTNDADLPDAAKKAEHGAKTYERKKRKIEAGLNRLRDRFGLDDHDLQS